MMKHLSLILLSISMSLASLQLLAQKHFHLTVKLPKTAQLEKIEIWLDNGKESKKLKPQLITKKKMVVAGDYFSAYAVVNLQYTPNAPEKGFAKNFFVNEKPATITFGRSTSTDSLFANYTLQNVLDFEREKKLMDDYAASERKRAIDYETLNGEKIFSSNDTAIRNYYFKVLRPALGRKRLQYIKNHTQSYFSFYIFRTDVAKPSIASWDSLLLVFNSFPASFRYSDEGNYLNAFLHGNLSKQKGPAIDFTAKDIHKNTVSLSQFKGKKYVLLHFWATWCSPCLHELPALKEISNQYNWNDLQIISIALPPSKIADYLGTINKYEMNWIHIYNKPDLVNKYGNAPTPRLCLIDKTGKLVYDNIGLNKNEDFSLKELKEALKELIHH